MDSESAVIIPIDRLVKVYVKMRDAKSEMTKRHDAEVAVLDEAMDKISVEFKRRALEQGTDGFKTDFGTVYLQTSLKSSCADWQIFYDWMQKENALDFLEKRISNGQIKTYMEEHEGALPPGISVFKEIEARVRRNSGK